MPLLPFSILGMWLKGLLAIAVLVGGLLFVRQWYVDAHTWEPGPLVIADLGPDRIGPDGQRVASRPVETGRRVFHWDLGWNRPTAELVAGLALLTWALAGQFLVKGLTMLTLKSGADDPRPTREGTVQELRRPDGSVLRVEFYGPPDAPPIVLTHGWGANSTEWYYAKKHLADRFRLIVWDLPGLGLSRKPDNNDYSLEKLARDLDAVLALAGGRPAILLGHSIGGMILLTFCRLFPESLGHRVAGLVLVHTTYTNPVRTTKQAALYTALEKPVLVPILHLTIALWPLVWLMNWMSYLNGSAHRSTHKQSFAGTETRGQLDFTARFLPHARPDVLARGMFGMMQYDATAVLDRIGVPTLVVDGDLDTTTTPEASERMARDVPGAQLVTLSPARHMGLIEHNERFGSLVATFAEQELRAGAALA